MWGIKLHYNDEISLARQIYISLKQQILAGQLPQKLTLPSTRELARGLGVSRNTVCEAYEMLWAEGFIISRQGALSQVAEGLHISTQKIELQEEAKIKYNPIQWDFTTGQPDLSIFPWKLWSKIIHTATDSLPTQQLGYSGPRGYEPLCAEIARWLWRSRSMEVNPEDVYITAGATQALHLLVNILNKDGLAIALENPSHPGIRTVIKDRGYPICWMPADKQGADVSGLKDKAVATVYVTPSHQFPLGGILPAGRRAALIRFASKNNCYIIEDDYDSEFRYSGSPISPIYSMDPSHTIYVGTFSKTMFPSLRIGFVILPGKLHSRWKHHRNYLDVQNSVLEQIALTEFLHTRKFDKHVQRMRRIYSEKRNILLSSVEQTFGKYVQPWGDASGLHIALQFPGMEFEKDFIQKCRNARVNISTVSQYCSNAGEHIDKLLLGYGHLNNSQIEEGIQTLGQVLYATRNTTAPLAQVKRYQ